MDLSIIDTILNVCRTPLDVLHIFIYVIITYIACLIAFYKFDKQLFDYHVYLPYKYAMKTFKSVYLKKFKIFLKKTFLAVWTPISNRTPYIAKILKSIRDKFFK